MSQIFISHTKSDEDFLDRFDRIFARTEIKAFRSELEDIPNPAWKTIRDEINKSNALFFLVGHELAKLQEKHDRSWEYTQIGSHMR